MDKEFIRTKLEIFMNYRKVYLKDKKELIFNYLNFKTEEYSNKLISIQQEYYNKFRKFLEILPDELKLDKSFIDDELIMWFIFTLNDVLNPIHSTELTTMIPTTDHHK